MFMGYVVTSQYIYAYIIKWPEQDNWCAYHIKYLSIFCWKNKILSTTCFETFQFNVVKYIYPSMLHCTTLNTRNHSSYPTKPMFALAILSPPSPSYPSYFPGTTICSILLWDLHFNLYIEISKYFSLATHPLIDTHVSWFLIVTTLTLWGGISLRHQLLFPWLVVLNTLSHVS